MRWLPRAWFGFGSGSGFLVPVGFLLWQLRLVVGPQWLVMVITNHSMIIRSYHMTNGSYDHVIDP